MSVKIEHDFKIGDHVVYPAHGVGIVAGVETQEVVGTALEVYVITFDHEKMTLRVPTRKARNAGLRALAEGNIAEVVRDLHRSESQPEQSYSERQLYESALDRMAREVAAIERIDREAAVEMLHKSLRKAA
jgi:CarD family transcriptional regulator